MKHFDNNPDVSGGLEGYVSAQERQEKTRAIYSSLAEYKAFHKQKLKCEA